MRSAIRLAICLFLIVTVCVLVDRAAVLAQTPTPDPLLAPDPAPVTLDPRTTTLLAIDFLESNCAPDPRCTASLPMAAAALAAARAANVPVVYSTHLAPDNV